MFSNGRRGFLRWIWQGGSAVILTGAAKLLGAQVAANPGTKQNDKNGAKAGTVEDKVLKIIRDTLRVDPKKVTPTARFCEDLGADSLDQVELCMAFEEAFGLPEIPDQDCERIDSWNDAVQYIKTHRKKDAPPQKDKSEPGRKGGGQ